MNAGTTRLFGAMTLAALQGPTVVAPSRALKPHAGGDRTVRLPGRTLGRNQPCFCGSGKKFKTCCKRR